MVAASRGRPQSRVNVTSSRSQGASSALPRSASQVTTRICIGMLPFVITPSEYKDDEVNAMPSSFRGLTDDRLAKVARRLRAFELVFYIEVPTTGPIWDTMDDQLQAAWATRRLIVVENPEPSEDRNPSTLAWMPVQFKKLAAGYRSSPIGSLSAHSFDLKGLKKTCATTNHLSVEPFFFLSLRFGDGRAPFLSEQPLGIALPEMPHACISAHIVHAFSPSEWDNFECTTTCPHADRLDYSVNDEDGPAATSVFEGSPPPIVHHSLPPTTSHSRLRSLSVSDDELPSADTLISDYIRRHESNVPSQGTSSSNVPQVASAVRQRSPSIEVLDGPPPALRRRLNPSISPATPLGAQVEYYPPTIAQSRLFPDGRLESRIPMPIPFDKPDSEGAVEWVRKIRAAARRVAPDSSVSIEAANVTDAAWTLMFLVTWNMTPFHDNKTFNQALREKLPARCKCRQVSLTAILGEQAVYSIGRSVGPALERAVIRKCIEIASTDQAYWRQDGIYTRLLPSSARMTISERQLTLRVHGFLALLHIVINGGVGPHPFSPWPIWLLLDGPSSFSVDIKFISSLAPFVGSVLDPYAKLDRTQSLPDMGPVANLLRANDIEPKSVGSSLSPAQWRDIDYLVLSKMLFSADEFESHPDFVAFVHGFNCDIGGQTVVELLPAEVSAKEILASMYNHDIKDVEHVIKHMEFTVLTESTIPGRDGYFKQRFIQHLTDYLRGSGHVDHSWIRAIVTPEELDACKDDKLFRVRHLLMLFTGSDLDPLYPDWKLKFSITHGPDSSDVYDPKEPASKVLPRPVSFQSCYNTVTVTIGGKLRALLSEERASPTAVLDFDAWIHLALMDTNTFSRD
ncbi:hypothetical protein PLICRDRAFT_176794 [Plicaturopsis crispa FD-325 SS-3]|nr:hypothetical protein PLICRDRAFT_176794 [Plicaturopsis crispa FD-325 SS-3]